MRDNMLVNMSGIDDQWMGVDMNIEHLINFLKVTVFTPRNQHAYLFAFRWYSLRRVFMRPGTASATFQLQVMSYVQPRSTLGGS